MRCSVERLSALSSRHFNVEANPLLLYKYIEFGMRIYLVVISEDIVTDFSPQRDLCSSPASCLHVWMRLIKFKHMIN